MVKLKNKYVSTRCLYRFIAVFNSPRLLFLTFFAFLRAASAEFGLVAVSGFSCCAPGTAAFFVCFLPPFSFDEFVIEHNESEIDRLGNVVVGSITVFFINI